jgi:hypothetical protein
MIARPHIDRQFPEYADRPVGPVGPEELHCAPRFSFKHPKIITAVMATAGFAAAGLTWLSAHHDETAHELEAARYREHAAHALEDSKRFYWRRNVVAAKESREVVTFSQALAAEHDSAAAVSARQADTAEQGIAVSGLVLLTVGACGVAEAVETRRLRHGRKAGGTSNRYGR